MKKLLQKALLLASMMLVTVSAFAQVRVTGVVKDQAGEPIIGAAVMELVQQMVS